MVKNKPRQDESIIKYQISFVSSANPVRSLDVKAVLKLINQIVFSLRYVIRRWNLKAITTLRQTIQATWLQLRHTIPSHSRNTHLTSEQITVTFEQGEFIFHLTNEGLQQIHQARNNRYELQLPNKLLTNLRQNALLADGLNKKKQVKRVYFQSGLTFCTHYYIDPEESQQGLLNLDKCSSKVVRTVISLDGDIFQQVCKDYLNYPRCWEIISAHHWLINKLLQHLHTSTTYYLDVFFWVMPTLGMICGEFKYLNMICRELKCLKNIGQGQWQDFLDGIIQRQDFLDGIKMRLLPLLIIVIWELSRDYLLPRFNRWLSRWVWSQLLTPNSFLKSFAKWMLRLG